MCLSARLPGDVSRAPQSASRRADYGHVMFTRLSQLSVRARLISLGIAAVGAVLVSTGVAAYTMQGMRDQSSDAAHTEQAAKVLSHAYESWILDDDQANMYAALAALRDPSQRALAETTWRQAVAARTESQAQLRALAALPIGAADVRAVQRILATLRAYNVFTLEMRRDILAGNIHDAVYVNTVANLKPSNALPKQFETLRDSLESSSAAAQSDLQSSASHGLIVLICLALLTAPLVLLLVVVIARSITAGLGRMLSAVDRIADGNLDSGATARGDEIARATAQLQQRIVGYLRPIADAADAVAKGNLAVSISPRSGSDTLGIAMASMLESLRGLIGELAGAGSEVASATQSLAAAGRDAEHAVGEIATAIGQVAEGATRQVGMVEGAQSAAKDTSDAAIAARDGAEAGVQSVEEASRAMELVRESSAQVAQTIDSLATKSSQIGGIVQTITQIADQTNLLALNAAIEAARAGEQGRGFAVVAEEVRKLAEESQTAAATIADLIGEIQAETSRTVEVVAAGERRSQDGVEIVDRAREAFLSIRGQVDGIAGQIQQIARSAAEIAAVAEESSATSEEVSASTQQTTASAHLIASGSEELAGTAEHLGQLVARFKL